MSKPGLGRISAQTMAPPAGVRTMETITGDILEAKRQGGEAILTMGRCLIEAKEMLSHGEWRSWLEERVEFSERSAQRFMRLAREWSNPTTLSDLGASKALMLLALPEGERARFVEDHNVIDMSARQLEQAIRDRDEARQAPEAAKADVEDMVYDFIDIYKERIRPLDWMRDTTKAKAITKLDAPGVKAGSPAQGK